MRSKVVDGFINLLVGHKFKAFLFGVLLTVFLTAGVGRLGLSNDYRAFIGEENSALQASDWLSERDGDGDETLLLIYRPASQDMFETTSFIQYSQVAAAAASLPYVVNTTSFYDQEKMVRVGEGGSAVYRSAPFALGTDSFSEGGLATLKRDALALTNVGGRFIATDGTSATVTLKITFDSGANALAKRDQVNLLLDAVNAVEADLEALRPGDKLFITGSTLFDHTATEVLSNDIRKLLPIVILFTVALVYFIYRSIAYSFVLLVLVLLPMIAAAGSVGWLGMSLSNLSMTGLLLVGTLACADVLHLSNSYFLQRRTTSDINGSLRMAFSSNFVPVAATSATTIIGQLAIVFSPSEPIRVMGWIVVIGTSLALVLAYMTLPLVLSLISPQKSTTLTWLSRQLASLARAAAARPSRVLGVFFIVLCVAVVGALQSRVTDSMAGWFSDDTEFNQGLTILNERYLGGDTATLIIEATLEDTLEAGRYPAPSESNDFFIGLQDQLSETFDGKWYSIITLGHVAEAVMRGDEGTSLIMPKGAKGTKSFSSEVVARSGLLTPYEPGRADYSLWYYDGDAESSFTTKRDTEAILSMTQAQMGDRSVQLSGIGVAIAYLSVENFWEIVKGSLMTFLLISVTLFLVFKSVRLGALALIPNALPILVTLGIWGFLSGTMNLAAITVYSVSLGIIVDDTIHVIVKYQHARTVDGHAPVDAIGTAIERCGVGLLTTTLIIAFGFGILGVSDFLLTAQRSTLAAMAILFALIFDLILLPVILVMTDKTSSAPSVTHRRSV